MVGGPEPKSKTCLKDTPNDTSLNSCLRALGLESSNSLSLAVIAARPATVIAIPATFLIQSSLVFFGYSKGDDPRCVGEQLLFLVRGSAPSKFAFEESASASEGDPERSRVTSNRSSSHKVGATMLKAT